MEDITWANRENYASPEKKRFLNDLYSNPSLMEKRSIEESIKCKRYSFVVEWQMDNPMHD